MPAMTPTGAPAAMAMGEMGGMPMNPQDNKPMPASGGMGGMMGVGTITATDLRLEQQGLGGTVSAYSSNGSQAAGKRVGSEAG